MGRSLNVFVLEENKAEAMYTKLILQKAKGAALFFFYDPEAVLERLAQKPDVLVCDAVWGGNDLLGFLAKVRQAVPHVQVVVHSSSHEYYLVEELQCAGVYKYLVKTEISCAALRKALEELSILIPIQEKSRREDA